MSDDHPVARGLRATKTFMDTYSRDVWFFFVTIMVMAALTLAYFQVQRNGDVARESCVRAKTVIPIQLKALRGAVAGGLITPAELERYSDAYPKGPC